VLELEVLIGKFGAIDRLSARAIALGEVASEELVLEENILVSDKLTTLDHELLDDAVECGALITEALLASSESTIS
jgi:hypothetical protein